MIITRTPFRVSFVGGGTDYPDWYREHGGAVLPQALCRRGPERGPERSDQRRGEGHAGQAEPVQ